MYVPLYEWSLVCRSWEEEMGKIPRTTVNWFFYFDPLLPRPCTFPVLDVCVYVEFSLLCMTQNVYVEIIAHVSVPCCDFEQDSGLWLIHFCLNPRQVRTCCSLWMYWNSEARSFALLDNEDIWVWGQKMNKTVDQIFHFLLFTSGCVEQLGIWHLLWQITQFLG